MKFFDFSKVKISKQSQLLISDIVKRASSFNSKVDNLSLEMDLTCVHSQMELNLPELLRADSVNFCHDIFGIRQHLNRQTGKLENFFVPRFAK